MNVNIRYLLKRDTGYFGLKIYLSDQLLGTCKLVQLLVNVDEETDLKHPISLRYKWLPPVDDKDEDRCRHDQGPCLSPRRQHLALLGKSHITSDFLLRKVAVFKCLSFWNCSDGY